MTGTAGNATVTVSWTAPADDGGSPILGYLATADPGGATCSPVSGLTTCTVPGLTNGTAYTFTVTARNAVGISTPSAPSTTITPVAPQRPLLPTGSRDGRTPPSPSLDGPAGRRVTDPGVRRHRQSGRRPLSPVSGLTTCTVTGLTNGTGYTFTVTAENAVGISAPSAPSTTVTPVAPPPPDTDGDGTPDATDTCPTVAGPGQQRWLPAAATSAG